MGKSVTIIASLAALLGLWFIFGGKIDTDLNVEIEPTTEIPADIRAHIESKSNLIVVTSPEPYAGITSPLVVKGRARGNWYFEASFPITVVNWDGLIIGQGYATAQGEWMTEEFVPFEGTITFDKPTIGGELGKRGTIIFHKDNASGLPEHDNALEIPITFN